MKESKKREQKLMGQIENKQQDHKFKITISTITSNINGQNIPIKGRDYHITFFKKQDPITCCLQESHFKYKDINRSKIKICPRIPLAGIYPRETRTYAQRRRKKTYSHTKMCTQMFVEALLFTITKK